MLDIINFVIGEMKECLMKLRPVASYRRSVFIFKKVLKFALNESCVNFPFDKQGGAGEHSRVDLEGPCGPRLLVFTLQPLKPTTVLMSMCPPLTAANATGNLGNRWELQSTFQSDHRESATGAEFHKVKKGDKALGINTNLKEKESDLGAEGNKNHNSQSCFVETEKTYSKDIHRLED